MPQPLPLPFSRRVIAALTKRRLDERVTDDRGAYWLITLAERADNTPPARHAARCRAAGVDPALVGTVRVSEGGGFLRGLSELLGLGETTQALKRRLPSWFEHRLIAIRRGVLYLFWPHIVALDTRANRGERRRRVEWGHRLDDTGWWSSIGGDDAVDEGQIELPIDPDGIDPSDPERIDLQLYGSLEEAERERFQSPRAGAPSLPHSRRAVNCGLEAETAPAFEALAARVVRASVDPRYVLTEDARDRLAALVAEHGVEACELALDRGESLRSPIAWIREVTSRPGGPLGLGLLPEESALEARVRGCIPLREGRPAVVALDTESKKLLAALVEAHGEAAIARMIPEAAGCDLPVQRIEQALADEAAAKGSRDVPAWKAEHRRRQSRQGRQRAKLRAQQQRAKEDALRPPAPPPEPPPPPVVEDEAAAEEWARRLVLMKALFPGAYEHTSALVAVGMRGASVVLGHNDAMFEDWVRMHHAEALAAAGGVLRGDEVAEKGAPPAGDWVALRAGPARAGGPAFELRGQRRRVDVAALRRGPAVAEESDARRRARAKLGELANWAGIASGAA